MKNIIAHIEQNTNGFIGWVPEFKGLAVQGESVEEVKKELDTSIRVKLSYDLSIQVDEVAYFIKYRNPCCKEPGEFYPGMTCSKCNKPFRAEIKNK